MRQKYRMFAFVKVADKLPQPFSHFDSGFDAIVAGTPCQLYSQNNVSKYSLYKLKNGEIIERVAWYPEECLTLLPNQDTYKAEEMIENFNLRSV